MKSGQFFLLIKLEKDAKKRVNTRFRHDDTLFYFFFNNYSYDTPYAQHSTGKKHILKTFFCLKILQCSP